MPEAPLEPKDGGLVPADEGWFVVNVRDAQWFDGNELGGRYTSFEGPDARFAELGFGIGILRPGEPSALYHGEEAEEDFLVLSGECLLLVEGEERLLRVWDFVHCPPWTEHIFVGAGDGPCVVVGVGRRKTGRGIRFPLNELALRHGAGAEVDTTDSKEAYAPYSEPKPIPCPPEFPSD